jgi:hypothetical protein
VQSYIHTHTLSLSLSLVSNKACRAADAPGGSALKSHSAKEIARYPRYEKRSVVRMRFSNAGGSGCRSSALLQMQASPYNGSPALLLQSNYTFPTSHNPSLPIASLLTYRSTASTPLSASRNLPSVLALISGQNGASQWHRGRKWNQRVRVGKAGQYRLLPEMASLNAYRIDFSRANI